MFGLPNNASKTIFIHLIKERDPLKISRPFLLDFGLPFPMIYAWGERFYKLNNNFYNLENRF